MVAITKRISGIVKKLGPFFLPDCVPGINNLCKLLLHMCTCLLLRLGARPLMSQDQCNICTYLQAPLSQAKHSGAVLHVPAGVVSSLLAVWNRTQFQLSELLGQEPIPFGRKV